MPDKEIWRPIPDFPDYEVSNLGRVKSLDRFINQKCNSKALRKGKVLKQHKNRDGYLVVPLTKNNKSKNFLVHRLVAKTFIINPQNMREINHIDGNKENNNVNNLCWCTRSENIKHAYMTGLEQPKCGTEHPGAMFTTEDIQRIRSSYIPRNREFGARALSRKYGVHRTTIERILRKETYEDVK